MIITIPIWILGFLKILGWILLGVIIGGIAAYYVIKSVLSPKNRNMWGWW